MSGQSLQFPIYGKYQYNDEADKTSQNELAYRNFVAGCMLGKANEEEKFDFGAADLFCDNLFKQTFPNQAK